MRIYDWALAQPGISAIDINGNPILDVVGGTAGPEGAFQAAGPRVDFMTRTKASAILAKIETDTGATVDGPFVDTSFTAKDDPQGRKMWTAIIDGVKKNLGQLFNEASRIVNLPNGTYYGGVDAPGRWVKNGAEFLFIPDAPPQQVNGPTVYVPHPGYGGMMDPYYFGGMTVPTLTLEQKIDAIYNRVVLGKV